MALFKADGTRVTKANLATTTVTETKYRVTTDLYETARTGREDDKPEGSVKTLYARANDRLLTQREIDNIFAKVEVEKITPKTGVAAGNTLVTVTGKQLDGVTAVTIGGTAVTSLTVKSDVELTFRTPAKTAGAYDVVLTGDGGTTTKTNGFTYTA